MVAKKNSRILVGNWRVEVLEDEDGHLNLFITNFDSSKIVEVLREPNTDDEYCIRLTTESIEMEYANGL